jgi:hypothetical protein
MLGAHTVRGLKLGTPEHFEVTFRPSDGDLPPGWVRVDRLRGRARVAIEPFIETVVADGIYAIEEGWIPAGARRPEPSLAQRIASERCAVGGP